MCNYWSVVVLVFSRVHATLYVTLSVRWSVRPSVHPSVTHFFGLCKNGGKWSEMTFHISTGFLFQSHTLNLSFNIPHNLSFTILLPKSSFKVIFSQSLWQYYLDNLSFLIFQSCFYNHSFTIILSQSLFHSLSFTIFLLQSFLHNLSHMISLTIFLS